MHTLLTKFRQLPNLTGMAFMLVAFLTGISGALQVPTLSLYLSNEVQVRPFLVGLFFTVNSLVAIMVSQFLASRSDKKGDRKTLIFWCCLVGALACLLFAFNRNYLILLFFGVLLSSFGSTSNPQLFALAREYSDSTGRESAIFGAIMRAQISLAWVVGPPLAFALALGFSFEVMYVAAAIVFVLCALMVWKLLPSMPKIESPLEKPLEAPRENRRDTMLLFIACLLMWSANASYLINMPLYVVNTLHLPDKLAGILMGTAAGLEIPSMLIAGMIAKQVGKRFLIRIAVVAGALFFIGLLFITGTWSLIFLQLLNAVFVGVLAGIGMLCFQDLMPGQAGAATTLFTNSIRVGWIIAGSLAGVIAEIWGYHAVFYGALVMMGAAMVCLWKLRDF